MNGRFSALAAVASSLTATSALAEGANDGPTSASSDLEAEYYETTDATRLCLRRDAIEGVVRISERDVAFVSTEGLFLNRMQRGCSLPEFEGKRLVFVSLGSMLCRNDQFEVYERAAVVPLSRCTLGRFRILRPAPASEGA
jgi:hypothetical protein